jgi:hypothetical protein
MFATRDKPESGLFANWPLRKLGCLCPMVDVTDEVTAIDLGNISGELVASHNHSFCNEADGHVYDDRAVKT